MKSADNQAEIRDRGHETNDSKSSDPHLHTTDGLHITMPSAGVEHYGIIKGMHEGSGDASKMKSSDD